MERHEVGRGEAMSESTPRTPSGYETALNLGAEVDKLRAQLTAANARIAELEARALKAAEDMRERCAKVCDEGVKWTPNFPPNTQRVTDESCFLLAKAIRALPIDPLADAGKEMEEGKA
jgi:hypothetical protein